MPKEMELGGGGGGGGGPKVENCIIPTQLYKHNALNG